MLKRGVRIALVLALAPFGLSGCLFNTPTNVVKRFVGTMKRLQWDRMERLVDWPSSEQALRTRLSQDRRAFLTEVAECITGYDIGFFGEERARSNFSFCQVSTVEYIETNKSARLRVTIDLTNEQSKTIEITCAKVGRTWRVVITPNLIEKDTISY